MTAHSPSNKSPATTSTPATSEAGAQRPEDNRMLWRGKVPTETTDPPRTVPGRREQEKTVDLPAPLGHDPIADVSPGVRSRRAEHCRGPPCQGDVGDGVVRRWRRG